MGIILTRLDQTSFWVGFIAASIFWMLLTFARPTLEQVVQKIKETRKAFKARTVSQVEEHYCASVHLQAQRMHLASSLFSLDEIAIEPKLMAPPPRVSPDETIFSDDLISELVPYLPSWPELSSFFNAPTLSIFEALSGKSDIVLTGQPGSGKTFALAYIALHLTKGYQQVTGPDISENSIPFLIHIADLDLNLINDDDPLSRIVEFAISNTKISDLHRISNFVKNVFTSGRALLLLDGTDELASENLGPLINFIKSLKQKYPQTQLITTGIPENLQGLVTLNFVPFTLASWEASDYLDYLTKWGQLWTKFIETEVSAQNSSVDPLLLNIWINSTKNTLTPLELTFLAWGCYAGDVESGNILDAIKAHINRLKPADAPFEALELLALQVFTSAKLTFEPRKAREWIKSFEPAEIIPSANLEGEEENKPQKSIKEISQKLFKGKPPTTPSLGLISNFAETGILISHRNNQMRFIHPTIGGYLAGKVLGNLPTEQILGLPNWSGKYLAMNYFAALGNADDLGKKILAIPDRPLERNTMIVARWLRDSQVETKWRNQVMEALVNLLRIPGQPLGFRGQVLAAILLGGDPGAPLLFRQMLASDDSELIQICMLGCASLKDTKAVDDIANLLLHPSPNVQRTASLALVTIGTQSAIDQVASALLHGDEYSRTTAAKALANHSEVGHDMLREGASMDDIMVRRAVTYGLGIVDQPWATEILAKMQLEDDQWIVRNAASEVLENKLKFNKFIPKRLTAPSECPWLIAFAGKKGVGISPDSPATDLLLMALTDGTDAEQLASLDYLRAFSSSNVFAIFYNLMYGNNLILREAIFRTIWEMGSRGVVIPDPQQFGVNY